MQRLNDLAVRLGDALRSRGLVLTSAESCTGGWIGQAITSVAGSSDWYDGGYITYSNAAKRDMLEVSGETLHRHGAVSEETAAAMAQGALHHSRAQVACAVSGIAGPGGGSAEKPVGTVCFGWAASEHPTRTLTRRLYGSRDAVRRQSVAIALQGLLRLLDEI